MKKIFAAAMSAALAAGSCFPVMAESETAFQPSTVVGEFSVTADGEAMVLSVSAEQASEDFVSLSAAVTLPASVTGAEEASVLELNDVVRVISGDIYINVEEISSLYEELTGASFSSVLGLVGIDQAWVEIPALELPETEEEVEESLPFDTDALMTDYMAMMECFDIQSAEDGTTTISFDGPALVQAVSYAENILDSVSAGMLQSLSGTADIDVSGIFEDYILAAAEGINEVTPEVSIEDAQAQITAIIDSAVEEVMSEIEISPVVTEDGESLSAQLQELIDAGAVVNGVAVISEEGFNMNVTAEAEGSSAVMEVSFDGTNMTATMTEDGTVVGSMNGVVSVKDNGLEFNLTAEADGETAAMNFAVLVEENGVGIALTVNDGEEEVALAANYTEVDGVSITETDAPEATLLRDVVKNAVILFYSASVETEEATETAE